MTGRLTDAEAAAQALVVEQLLGIVRGVLDGDVPRPDAERWAEVHHDTLRRHPTAHSIVGALACATWTHDGELLIRRQDLEAFVADLHQGDGLCMTDEPLAYVARPIARVERDLGLAATRWWLDGLGLRESIQFASRATGRVFAVVGGFDERGPSEGTQISAPRHDDVAVCYEDLVRHLNLEPAEVLHVHEALERRGRSEGRSDE